MLSVMASVGVDGRWPETVDIRCTGSAENAFAGPWMKGRGAVVFGEVIQELRATLQERESSDRVGEGGEARSVRVRDGGVGDGGFAGRAGAVLMGRG
jgi:hypothetical protein